MSGHDLMVSAPTGTGKTAAFVLAGAAASGAAFGQVRPRPRVLVLTPTRAKLALQVTSAVEKIQQVHASPAHRHGAPAACTYPKQRQLLDRPLDILVATPGRLIDFMDQGPGRFLAR